MTKHFQIIRSNTGRKLACEVLDEPCARCAKTYAERQHKFNMAVAGRRAFDVISVCNRCAKEYLADRPLFKFGWLPAAIVLLIACVASFYASFAVCAWLIIGHF